jgi:hypothetical protein
VVAVDAALAGGLVGAVENEVARLFERVAGRSGSARTRVGQRHVLEAVVIAAARAEPRAAKVVAGDEVDADAGDEAIGEREHDGGKRGRAVVAVAVVVAVVVMVVVVVVEADRAGAAADDDDADDGDAAAARRTL